MIIFKSGRLTLTYLFRTRNMTARNLADYAGFQTVLNQAKNIVVLTGAGVSAESGIPVFRGAGGLWRRYRAENLATPTAFEANPSLVWEFYHYRRNVAFNAQPNKAHLALAAYEQNCKREGRNFNIITQNVDGLHQRAGSENVVELHGALRKVICTRCKLVEENHQNPIVPALANRGDPNATEADLPIINVVDLPKCSHCSSLTRPYIVWFGESLDPDVLQKAHDLIDECDLCLVVGTSSVVYPAAMFAPSVAEKGKPVAEFNLNEQPANSSFSFHFSGPCGVTLPKALGVEVTEQN